MKYLIIIIEVFITNNILYKNVLIQIIILIKTNIFQTKKQINRKKPTTLYTVKNNSILTYNHMSYIYVIGCCLLPMA